MDLFFTIQFENSFFFSVSSHENQGQIMGWHEWDSIFMITMASSRKYHLRKHIQYRVYIVCISMCFKKEIPFIQSRQRHFWSAANSSESGTKIPKSCPRNFNELQTGAIIPGYPYYVIASSTMEPKLRKSICKRAVTYQLARNSGVNSCNLVQDQLLFGT